MEGGFLEDKQQYHDNIAFAIKSCQIVWQLDLSRSNGWLIRTCHSQPPFPSTRRRKRNYCSGIHSCFYSRVPSSPHRLPLFAVQPSSGPAGRPAVHDGGAPTTSVVIRSGVPNTIFQAITMFADQTEGLVSSPSDGPPRESQRGWQRNEGLYGYTRTISRSTIFLTSSRTLVDISRDSKASAHSSY